MTKGRVEAFSDGVLAVAITLLVLDLHADGASEHSLARQLADEWPAFAAYVVSFFTIGVIWVNHHALFDRIARADRTLLFLNLGLLMFVTTIPFTTSTLATYLNSGGSDARVAALMYGASMEGMAISFTAILGHSVGKGLLLTPVEPTAGRRAVRRFGIGSIIYPIVTLVGLVSSVAMLVLYGVLIIFYMADQVPVLPLVQEHVNGG